MKKLFIKPVMDISVFDVENIVTGSAGVAADPNEIDSSTYTALTTDWAVEGSELTFKFTF